uniref:Protein kinase domain-containing protein n=1 Tax=Panagrolaimus superbus TaxID=310955 RepID=A0A914XWJ1_9BILA
MILFLFCFLQILINLEGAPLQSQRKIRCQVGYYGNDCSHRCNPLCQKCEEDADNCSECKPGNFLTLRHRSGNYYCKDDCNTDESRIDGKLFYACSSIDGYDNNDNNKRCNDGSYLNSKKICKLCDSLCGTCVGPEIDECTSCKMNEFQVSEKRNRGTFECSKSCEKSSSSTIPGKNYRFCRDSSKESSADVSDINDHLQRLNESSNGSGGFHFDWLHILCIILISNLAVAIAAFLYFKFRNKKEHFTLHSTQYEMAQTEPEEEIQIVTKDQINFGETKKLLGRGAFGKVYKCTFTDPEGRAIHAAVKVIDPIYRDADIETERRVCFIACFEEFMI